MIFPYLLVAVGVLVASCNIALTTAAASSSNHPGDGKLIQSQQGKVLSDKESHGDGSTTEENVTPTTNHLHNHDHIGGAGPPVYSSNCEGCLMFNLTADPYESDNLLDTNDDSVDSTIDWFEARIDHWAQYFVTPVVTEYDTSKWVRYGCGPWLTSDFEVPVIEQKYFYEDAPNIIYVLVDDWGWNDLGARSTFMNWTTPNLDKLYTQDAIALTNYYSNELCAPSRASLLTGRYAFRLGFQNATDENALFSELDLDEITIAQELQSAGYRTYMVGKWDVGFSTEQSLPNNRGFDYFYGYYNGFVDYYTKRYGNFKDLHENDALVTNEAELDTTYHGGYLYEAKAEQVLRNHSANFPNTPLFLYYAMQLVHTPYEAPDRFMERCADPSITDDTVNSYYQTYCAMNAMLDEAIGNLTCTLAELGMNKNTVLIISSDNGGDKLISGNAYPYRGQKGSYFRGGVSSTAMIVSDLIPENLRGTEYAGNMHITDWLPTIMRLATNGEWERGYDNQTLDGVNMWDAIISGAPSPHNEIVHVIGDGVGTYACILYGDIKFSRSFNDLGVGSPLYVFDRDLAPQNAVSECILDSFYEDVSSASTYLSASSPRMSVSKMTEVKATVTNVATDIYDGVTLTSAVMFMSALVVMFLVKSGYDYYYASSGKQSKSESDNFSQPYNGSTDAYSYARGNVERTQSNLSLFEEDAPVGSYGAIKHLCSGP